MPPVVVYMRVKTKLDRDGHLNFKKHLYESHAKKIL